MEAQDRFAVAPCICRRKAEISGAGCDAPLEACLSFGDMADYYVRNELGRPIDLVEVHDILTRADEANLVLQPSNSQEAAFICACCGCCCGILTILKMYPKPSAAVTNQFIAQYEPETCIGCGLCVSTCPTDSLTLARKPAGEQFKAPPVNMDATLREISAAWSK